MLLMAEKRIRREICRAIHRNAKPNDKYIKIMIKMKIHHILCILMQIIYMAVQFLK